jgi:hypothetical protein
MTSTTNENAPDAGQGIEGNVTTSEGRDMSTVTHTTPSTQDPDLFRDWARDYAASWGALVERARAHAAWDILARAGKTAELCDLVRRTERWRAPHVPAAAWPDWATNMRFGEPIAGGIPIWMRGAVHGGEGNAYSVWLEEFYMVTINDTDGNLGDYDHEPASIRWDAEHEDVLTLDEARTLRDNLTAAIAELETPA